MQARKIELQQSRAQRRRRGYDAAEGGKPQRYADQGDGENADQSAARDAAVVQRRDQHQTKQAQHRRRIAQIAERDQRRRARHHDLGLFQRNNTKEQPDAGRYRQFQIPRDGIDDVFANAQDRDQKEDHA